MELIILIVLILNFGWMLKQLEDINANLTEIKKLLAKR